MALDWTILRTNEPVDIAGNFARGYQVASALVDKFHERNALATLANQPNDPSALATLYQVNPAMGQHFEARGQQLEQTQRRTAAYQQYAGGDTTGARAAALGSGDVDLADQFSKLDTDTQKRAADFWEKAGPVAYKLKQIADPAARQAQWTQDKAILQSEGVNTDLLNKFDPTNDQMLDGAITTAQKMADIISQNKPQEFNVEPGAARYERDPVTGAIRTIIAPNTGGQPFGTPAAQGGGGAVGVSPAAASVASVLSSAGLPAPVVAGFMGNFHVEGGYDGAQGDGGSASGIAQWHNDRAATFQRVIGKPVTAASPAEQAQFVAWEMKNPQAAGMTVAQRDAILAAKTPAEAAALIDQHYERSSGRDRQVRMSAATAYSGDAGTAPVHAVSKSEFAALPSGSHFIALDDPTHTVRVKP